MTRGHSGRSATRTAGISRSSTIRLIKPLPSSDRAIRRLLLTDAVDKTHTDSRGAYGSRRVKAALQIESGLIVNHKLVASIMQELQLHGLPKGRTSRHNLIAVRTVSDLVNQNFTATGPDQL